MHYSIYNAPYGWPNLLRLGTAKACSLVPDTTYDQVALIAYQITNTDRIWKDSGSGEDEDFSSHRVIEPKDTYSLGDIGLGSHSSPSYGIAIKEVKSGDLAAPIGYRRWWNDRGSGARDDVAFYEPICPSGYK